MIKAKSKPWWRGWACLALVATAAIAGRAGEIILHLKNGDRIAGTVISEDTNRVVVSTSWIKELAIPSAEIQRREPAPPACIDSPKPAPAARVTPAPVVAGRPAAKHWKAEVRVGADYLQGVKNQQIYFGRFNLAYARPYNSRPIRFFRNVFDYIVDYGWTQNPPPDGDNTSVVSANRMYGSDKADFDVGNGKWFVYSMAGAGYDKIRKTDFKDEIGPGVGYHLVNRPNLLMNVEFGFNYQEQYRADQTTSKNFYLRTSEDLAWKLNHDLTFKEKFEFMPRADFKDFRFRAEATLSYALWHNMSLHLSLLDLYDTDPAQSVTANDLQIHTSLGVTF